MRGDTPLPFDGGDEPKRDWEATLDLNRTKLTQDIVDNLHDAMVRQQIAADDIKILKANALEQEFSKRDIAAMVTIARLRLKDQKSQAQEKLEALERIGKIVQFDLFDFSAVR